MEELKKNWTGLNCVSAIMDREREDVSEIPEENLFFFIIISYLDIFRRSEAITCLFVSGPIHFLTGRRYPKKEEEIQIKLEMNKFKKTFFEKNTFFLSSTNLIKIPICHFYDRLYIHGRKFPWRKKELL